LDRSEKKVIRLQRANILETYEDSIKPRVLSNFTTDSLLIKELKKVVDELRDLRKEHPDLDYCLIGPKTALASVYARHRNPREAVQILHEVYNFLKMTQFSQIVTDVAFQISIRYSEFENIKESKKWFDIALKEFAEPIRGKFTEEETIWKIEAIQLAEKLSPTMMSVAKIMGYW